MNIIWRMPGSQLQCLIGRNRTARKRFALMRAELWPIFGEMLAYAAKRPDPITPKRRKREQRAKNA